jgi:hypothetical protein
MMPERRRLDRRFILLTALQLTGLGVLLIFIFAIRSELLLNQERLVAATNIQCIQSVEGFRAKQATTQEDLQASAKTARDNNQILRDNNKMMKQLLERLEK